MVEPQPSKLIVWVRFPLPAPKKGEKKAERAKVSAGLARATLRTLSFLLSTLKRAHIAQSVEHFLGKEEVTGSNPVMGSISCHDPGPPGRGRTNAILRGE